MEGVGQKLRGNTARSAETNWPEKYFMPCNTTLSNQTRGRRREVVFHSVATAQRLAGHGSSCGRWWEITCTSLILLFLSSTYHTVFTWTYTFSHFCSSYFLPGSAEGGMSKQLCRARLLDKSMHHQHIMPSSHNTLLHLHLMIAPHVIFYFLSMILHHSYPSVAGMETLWKSWLRVKMVLLTNAVFTESQRNE